jgi:hypothetical protein
MLIAFCRRPSPHRFRRRSREGGTNADTDTDTDKIDVRQDASAHVHARSRTPPLLGKGPGRINWHGKGPIENIGPLQANEEGICRRSRGKQHNKGAGVDHLTAGFMGGR